MENNNKLLQLEYSSEKDEIKALLEKYHHNYNGVFKAKGREHYWLI